MRPFPASAFASPLNDRMKILLIGYGKMGQAVEKHALARNHEIAGRLDAHNALSLSEYDASKADAAIEFTGPDSAFENIRRCLLQGIPVVSGSTGWLEKKPEIEALCREVGGAFFYASNFSVGANILFALSKYLARVMAAYPEYNVCIEEIHHTQKKDAPSGTAVTLAEGILKTEGALKKIWVNHPTSTSEELEILSVRENNVPGTHTVSYSSSIDDLEIKHTAHNRDGFSLGAVLAAEWIIGKKGNFGMQDMLNI